MDIVILLDWNTTQETLSITTDKVATLKVILEKWDPRVRYKKIKILNGGYQEWLTRYPAFSSNPNVTAPDLDSVEDEILDTIEYPDWVIMDEDEELRRKVKNAKKANKNTDINVTHGDNKSTSKHARSDSNDAVSPASKPKNFTSHVTISIDGKRPVRGDSATNSQRLNSPDALPQHKTTTSNKLPQNEVTAKPVIDRSNKPVTLKSTYDSRCKEVLRFMKELNELAKSKAKLANELLEHEYQLYDKPRDASDERYLHGEIKSLKVKLEDMVSSSRHCHRFLGVSALRAGSR